MAKFDMWLREMKAGYTSINKSTYGYYPCSPEYLGVYIANTAEEAEELASEVTKRNGIFEAEEI